MKHIVIAEEFIISKLLNSQSVAPISGSSDEAMILKMMDENDGVVNRRTKKVCKKKEHRLLLNGMADSQDELDMA